MLSRRKLDEAELTPNRTSGSKFWAELFTHNQDAKEQSSAQARAAAAALMDTNSINLYT
jgi:hypothetical protein